MKKLFSVILTVCMILSVCASPAFAESTIKITVDGKVVDCAAYGQEPTAINGTTLVPLRSVFEALGATVLWDGDTQSVVSTRGNDMIVLRLNSVDMIVNSEVKKLSVPAQSMNERTMVPVRAIAEAFGCEVKWDGATSTVIVLTNKEETPVDVVTNLYKAMTALDMEKAETYFVNETVAEEYTGGLDWDVLIGSVEGVDTTDPRMNAILQKYMVDMFGTITYTIDTATVHEDTAVVTTTVTIPNFANMAFANLNIQEEELEVLLAKAAERCGVSVEELLFTTDEELLMNFEYAVMEVSFEYSVDLMKQEMANGNVETFGETINLEKIGGVWLITEIK